MVIELEVRDSVALVRIVRPEAKNSLTLEQIGELRAAVDAAAASDARCFLLTGTGACFCAGRDLKEADPDSEPTYRIMTDLINPLLVAVRNFPVPTIAAVQGPALGLGLGLALGCDIVLAAENAVFGSPFRNFGGVTDSGGHYFLSERVGPHRAAELIFTGRLISGRDAASLGLINHAVPAPQLPGQSWKWCRDIASGPTAAFKASKRILAVPRGFEETLEMEARAMETALKGADGREGMTAFKSKRAPRFIGQ